MCVTSQTDAKHALNYDLSDSSDRVPFNTRREHASQPDQIRSGGITEECAQRCNQQVRPDKGASGEQKCRLF